MKDDKGKTMGDLIREAREAKRLTRKEVGEAMKMSDQYVYQVETGRRVPTLETLWEFANVLGIDPQMLDYRLASAKEARKGAK